MLTVHSCPSRSGLPSVQCSQVASKVEQQGRYGITHIKFRSYAHGTHTLLHTPGKALMYLASYPFCWQDFTYKDGLFQFHDGTVRTACPMCQSLVPIFSKSPCVLEVLLKPNRHITREIASLKPHDLDECLNGELPSYLSRAVSESTSTILGVVCSLEP